MATSTFYARGHSGVGHVSGGSDVSWGRTTPEGVSLQLGVQSVDLESAQTLMEVDTGITRVTVNIVIRLVSAALQVIQRAFGMSATAFTGDLTAGTPLAEQLDIADTDLGSQEQQLYSLGPGPASTRRITVYRAKVSDLGGLDQAKPSWMLPSPTWRALAPASGPVIRILDAT